MANRTEEDPENKPQPQIVRLNKAFKLAEQWVNNMTKSSVEEKSKSVEFEGRPTRLGIGVTVPKESRVTRFDNPVERELLGKLNANKNKATMRAAEMAAKDLNDEEESEEEDSGIKTRYFGKIIPLSFNFPQPGKKKFR